LAAKQLDSGETGKTFDRAFKTIVLAKIAKGEQKMEWRG
jgi:hypothetical protein